MTDWQAKDWTLAEFKRVYRIDPTEYPYGTCRVLIWFKICNNTLIWTQTPVICDNLLYDRAMAIQNESDFYQWGVNPFTGEKADIQFAADEP